MKERYYKIFKKFKKIFISNYGHKPFIYQKVKTFFFYKTTSINGVVGYSYKLKTWRRFLFGRERYKCLRCKKSITHLAADANYCGRNCYAAHRFFLQYKRPLLSILLGKNTYKSLRKNGLKRIIFSTKNFRKYTKIKTYIKNKIKLIHLVISWFTKFYDFLFFKCAWCRTDLQKNEGKLYCNTNCKSKYRKYSKRLLPIWFYKNIYTKYNLYKIRWEYYPKTKNMITSFFVRKIKFVKEKIKEIKRRSPEFLLLTCKQCEQEFKWEVNKYYYKTRKRVLRSDVKRKTVKNCCSKDCAILFKETINKRRKERNLITWGTEERPDAETRKRVRAEKRRAWEDNKKKTDPAFKLLKRMRVRTRKVLKGIYKEGKNWNGKRLSIFEKLGVKSGQELREHIEARWQEGMNWDNYGVGKGFWVVDHDTPIAYYKNNFDLLNDIEIQKKCFGKENLKPMWWVDNAHKAAKLNYNEFR
tara:strand:- start:685 stop:2094 length:1410 start_codon:yes stop_codon:yes gene_type:complete